MSTWQFQVRRIFLLQLALLCGVAACGLIVLAHYDDVTGAWFPPAVFAAVALVMLAVIWLGDRAGRRAIAPVCWILRAVAAWDPRRPNPDVLSPEHLPREIRGDVRKLADALHGFGLRLREHAVREREFTRAASHELRTPLTVIRVASDLIGNDPALSEASRRSLERIRVAGAGMEAIIDALLLLARSEETEPECEEFAVGDVLERELQRIRPQLEQKLLQLKVVHHADPELHASPRMLQVVLGQLLDNAVRFTPAGEVRVHLHPDRLQVEDTGPGMDATALEHATEPFFRGSDLGEGSGPGLGLTIAHRLALRCGWHLVLERMQERGTRASLLFRPETRCEIPQGHAPCQALGPRTD